MQGTNIKAVRLKRGMSQQELADAIGVTKSTISKYEKGQREPKYNVLRGIAAALGVNWTDLVPADEQCEIITKHIVEKADLTVKDENGNIIRQGDGKPWVKASEFEMHRMGILQFESDEDRTAFFYSHLNTDGMLMAGKYFFKHLKPEDMKEVADYIEQLAETPQYQRPEEPDEDKK